MQAKSTSELERELTGCANLRGYLKRNESALYTPDLSDLLHLELEKSGLTRAELLRRSNLNPIYGYQILSGKRRPGRDTLLCLCFGLGLRAAEAQGLLLHAGYAQLYVRDPRDSILFYALDSGMSLLACNQQLDVHGEASLS